MIRVLVFVEYGWRNGGENSWLAIAELLSKSDCQFVVACPGETEFSRHVEKMGLERLDWSVSDPKGQRKSQAAIRSDIENVILLTNPDLLHANSLSTARLIGPVAERISIPALGYLRDIIKLSSQAIQDINCCHKIIAVSNATREFHIDRGLDQSRCVVVHNGVDLEHFQPQNPTGAVHRELRLANEQRILLCVGQIGMRKGTDVVIESFKKIHAQFPDTVLLVVGMRNSQKQEAIEFEDNCRQMATDLPIYWVGRRTDISELMNESTLLLHGARQEPLGRVLLEAMAAGLPFVATDVGGTKEIVESLDSNSTMCKPDCPSSMAEFACHLLANTRVQKTISRNFRLAAESKFSVQDCSHKTLEIYRELVSVIDSRKNQTQ